MEGVRKKMRQITSFLVKKTNKTYPEIIEEGKERGFLYPAPHVYVYKFEPLNENEEWKHIRGRPIASPCALIRDSNIARNSIGIMLYCKDDEEIHPDAMILAAHMIKLFTEDLGIKDYSIITDHEDKKAAIDTMQMHSSVAMALSIFNKRI